MRLPVFAVSTTTPLVVVLLALTGCNRAADAPAPTPAAEPSAIQEQAAAPAAVAPADVLPPEGVLRAYVWDCDGGLTLRMKNLYREDAIALEMHEGPRRLPLVASASGAKYSAGSLTFWIKGGTAVFERAGTAPVNCREARGASLLADARERGVRVVGRGNEPGWTVEVGPGARLEFVTNYGEDRHVFDAATEAGGETVGTRVVRAGQGDQQIQVAVTAEACADDMSGEQFEQRVVVQFGGKTLRGCGTTLR
jgi:membrane-bound inhibitor of C-type lysozyme